MNVTPDDGHDEELLDLLGGDLAFARKMRVVCECQKRLEEEEDDDDQGATDAASPRHEQEPAIPKREAPGKVTFRERMQLGDYTLLRRIDQGGMGIVYEAWDNSMNRRVALKLLRSGVILADSTAMARFRREARLPSSLNHPGICTVYDAGVVEGTPYIAMAYVEGETLQSALARDEEGAHGEQTTALHRLFEEISRKEPAESPPTDASSGPVRRAEIAKSVQLIERVARSLHFFHEAGFVHRDIKPSNIMVSPQGDPVILDFGLVRAEDAETSVITQTGELLGTPAYIAPEQIAGKPAVPDRRCDVYSLGVTVYECLTGQLPFDAPTRAQLFHQILTTPPRDPRRLNPKIPRELRSVLETALEKDPELRYQTALDFAEDLRRVRCHETIRARPTGMALKLGRWVQRNPLLAAFVVSVNVLLVISLVLLGIVVKQDKVKERVLDVLRRSVRIELEELWDKDRTRVARITAEERSLLVGNLPSVDTPAQRLTYGVYAYRSPIEMLTFWGPFVEAVERGLSKELSRSVFVDFAVFKGYGVGREELIKGEEVDFMRLGPASWVEVKELEPGIELLAKLKHDGPFEGCIFTHTGSGIRDFMVEQLRGKRFAFGDERSTLGNFYPKQALLQLGLRKSDLAPNSKHLGSHDQVIAAVARREFALGTAKKYWVEKARREGAPLRVLHTFETIPIPFVARRWLEPAVEDALRNVLVGLDDSETLRSLREHTDSTIIGFQAAIERDYQPVVDAIKAAERFDSEE